MDLRKAVTYPIPVRYFSDELLDDICSNEGTYYNCPGEAIASPSNPPTIFYTFTTTENIEDVWTNEGTYYTAKTKAIAPVSTPPTIFYTV